jgi:hemin uptake protein HemP
LNEFFAMASESSDPKVTPLTETTPASRQSSADQLSGESAASLRSKRLWSTTELMGGETEILIEHNGSIYRLRRTRQGKLILSK